MSPKHCNSETLLAYLDHELPEEEQRAVMTHLAACWRCRARTGELERQIQRLVQEFTAGDYPTHLQTAEAKRQFLAWRDHYEGETTYSVTFAGLPRQFPWPVAASLLMAAIAGFWLWSSHPSPNAVLARAEHTEQAVIDASPVVHESYRLEIRQLSPRQAVSRSYLDLWSDRSSDRFAWRWKDEQHRLTLAEWNPDGKERYVFRPQGFTTVKGGPNRDGNAPSLAETLEPATTVQQLNEAFVQWVGHQQWHLISITRDFASFSNRHGVAFSMRRVRLNSSSSTIILEATRARHEKTLTLTLEIDEATGQPIAEVAQISSREFSVQFRVAASQIEPLRVLPALFAVFRAETAIASNIPPKPPALTPPVTPVRKPSIFDIQLLNAAEVDVVYMLHRAGLCLGGRLAVHQDPKLNLVILTGMVETAQRREKIVQEISQLPSAKLIRTELKTPDEAMAESTPSRSAIVNTAGNPNPASSPVLAIETLIDQSSLPEKEKLALKARMANHSNELVSATENTLQEAWALKRLAHYFTLAQTERWEGKSRMLLSQMAADHLKALRRQVSTLESLTGPMKTILTQQHDSLSESLPNERTGTGDWSWTADLLVSRAEQLVKDSQLLFALRGNLPAGDNSTTAADLLKALPRLGEILNEAEEQLGRMASGDALTGKNVPTNNR